MKVKFPVTWMETDWIIEGEYTKAIPPSGPSFESGGEPGEPESLEIEYLYVETTDRDGELVHVDMSFLLREVLLKESAIEALIQACFEAYDQ